MAPSRANLLARGTLAALLAFIWFRVIDHLRVEWTVNESYAYGWAVPFLCALLLWRRWKSNDEGDSARSPSPISNLSPDFPLRAPRSLLPTVFLLAAFLVTRWISVANPDWRLVSWALALEAIALSLLLIPFLFPTAPSNLQTSTPRSPLPAPCLLPLLFFLVAVPWPSQAEAFAIQHLTRLVVAATAELLNGFGLVAITHGNVIETAGGLVDVDQACSGIRSLQAALMLSLFFGEWQRLEWKWRLALCALAVPIACTFNLARTLTLALIATKQGSAAVTRWHDPTGIVILLGCFVTVWAIAAWMAKRKLPFATSTLSISDLPSATLAPRSLLPACSLLALLIAGEIIITLWYRTATPLTVANWQVSLPRENTTFKPVELPPAAHKILRFNESQSGAWQERDGTLWQMIYLRWLPGRAAVQLARNHTPEICLPAAGKNLRGVYDVEPIHVSGLALPFRCYETEQKGRSLFVFYTLWEEGVPQQHTRTELLTWQARWRAVLERRRNPGQRVIQIGIWSARNRQHAEDLLRAQLPKLLHTQDRAALL